MLLLYKNNRSKKFMVCLEIHISMNYQKALFKISMYLVKLFLRYKLFSKKNKLAPSCGREIAFPVTMNNIAYISRSGELPIVLS